MTYQLYPHQRQLVDEARQAIASGHQGILLQSPAGSGKSIMIADIAKGATDKKNHILFVAHRQELIDQIRADFIKNEVDPKYTTIQTPIRAVNRLGKIPEPTIIITDETHHSRAASYRKIYDYFPNAYRLGFTATPWRMSGKGFKDIYSVMVRGQSVDWLIENNYLAPFRYFAPTVIDETKLKSNKNQDYKNKDLDEVMEKASFGDIVQTYNDKAKGEQAILYAHNIEYSKRYADLFNQAGIHAKHADGKTPKAERENIMRGFKNGEFNILCNVDLISEGFNVPDCSTVILLRPTQSLSLHIQQSMRPMRYQKNKIATIIDHVGNFHKHGVPNTPHEWTIEDIKKRDKNDAPKLSECPHCFSVIEKQATGICPLCGMKLATEQEERDSELKNIDSEIEEIVSFGITTDYRKIELEKKYRGKDTKELTTLEDWYVFTQVNGWKTNSIKFRVPELKNASFSKFHSELKPIKEKYADVFN